MISDATIARCEFNSGDSKCRGWFYAPDASPPYPCVVMAHAFGANPAGPLGVVARGFAESGMAALAFDYRNFGESDGEPRQLLAIQRQLEDWAAAVAYARGREDVDLELVGLWGSSLSGGLVLSVAARDPTIAAVVSQAPFVDGLSVARATGLKQHLRTLPALVADLVQSVTGGRPYLIKALGPPGARAMIDARFPELYGEVLERTPGWTNGIAARSVVELYRYRPIREAKRISCPLLLVLSYVDRVAPPAPGTRMAENLPYVELAMLRARHFDFYAGDAQLRALQTEVQFMSHHIYGASKEARRAA